MSSTLDHCPVVEDLARHRRASSREGEAVTVTSQIPLEFAETLFQQVRARRPTLVVEIGMAFGMSSLAILKGLEANGHGRLISIDPYQSSQWHGCGLASVERAGLAHRHELIEKPDYQALPQLLDEEPVVDFAYIDGWHTFDYALLNFWYLDKMLPRGGIVAFNDCALPAVRKVIRFVKSHRRYREVTPRRPPAFSWSFRAKRLAKKLVSGGCYEDRYFEKHEAWEPDWNFFRRF